MEQITVEAPPEGAVIDPRAWFASPGPLELEIGCGKGGFLLRRAREAPGVRLLGIEWANKYFRYCADRMARWQFDNVRVMRTDARVFVMRHLPPACLSALHLYHPDPWPKRRHHKRRLVQADFVEAVVRVLVPGGRWYLQTDHAEYFAHIQSLLAERPGLTKVTFPDVGWAPPTTDPLTIDNSVRQPSPPVDAGFAPAPGAEWMGTNFEIKYRREGRSIHRAVYQRHEGTGETSKSPKV